MLLTQVRSIQDVLDSGESARLTDSFRNARWYWHEVSPQRLAGGTDAGQTGRVEDDEPASGWLPSKLNAQMGPLEYQLLMDQRPQTRTIENTPAAGTRAASFVDYSSRDAILGLSVGNEATVFGDERSRINATLDVNLFTTSHQTRQRNTSTTLMFSAFAGRRDSGFGVGGRYGLIWPATELALSFPITLQHIRPRHDLGGSFTRPGFGVRLDAGFTSFLTFYLELKRTSSMQDDGRIRSGPAMGAGVQFAAPRCRIFANCD